MSDLQRVRSFDLHLPVHRWMAVVVLVLCFASWAVQLGGVASLQDGCAEYLTTEQNDPNDVKKYAAAAMAAIARIDPAQPVSAALLKQALGALLQMEVLTAHRTTYTSFVLTPDWKCSETFRYQWLNVALQLLVLVLAFWSLWSGCLRQARVAICSLLVVSSMLAINNAHSFFHARHYVEGTILERAKVFFAGCFAVIACNLFLLIVLGVHDETACMKGQNVKVELAAACKHDDGQKGDSSPV